MMFRAIGSEVRSRFAAMPPPPRITKKDACLIVGGDSMIGRALCSTCAREGIPFWCTTRRSSMTARNSLHCDLSRHQQANMFPLDISVAFICAGATSIAECSRRPKLTRAINVTHTVQLARLLAEHGCRVVFLSTNLVFDGSDQFPRHSDPVCPLTEYGAQKAEAEREILALSDDNLVVRLSKVVGPRTRPFVDWVRRLDGGGGVRPFADMIVSPISLNLCTCALVGAATARISGILQISAPQDMSYVQAAEVIAAEMGVSQRLVCSSLSVDCGVHVEVHPTHTTMDTSRVRRCLGLSIEDAPQMLISGVFGGGGE